MFSAVPLWAYGLALFAFWILMNFRTTRSEGKLIKVHPFRRMLAYIMPTRTESAVYFDSHVRAEKLLEYVEQARQHFHCDVSHVVLAATAKGLEVSPTLNRFVVGRRLYQRNRLCITTSVKRQKKGRKAKISAIKLDMPAGEDFATMCARFNERIGVERSETVTYTDKELNLFEYVPRPILRLAVLLFRWLDHYNLLPASFIENDAMYTSLFVANLGSLDMAAGYHHLYEWGTCPLFAMVGKIEDQPVVEGGKVVVGKVMTLRYTLDERVDDGLNASVGIALVKDVLEDPFTHLACLGDGPDDRPPIHNGIG